MIFKVKTPLEQAAGNSNLQSTYLVHICIAYQHT